MPPSLTKLARAPLPALLTTALALSLWLSIDHTPAAIAGWSLLLFPLTTVTTILATSLSKTAALSFTLLTLLTALLLIILRPLAPAPAAALWILLTAWSLLFTAATWSLRRFGPIFSAAAALTLSCLTMALPVIAMPLVHPAAHWGTDGTISPWQNRLVQFIAHACPFFPALHTLRPAVKIDWGTLPGMYAWSGLGQEIPLALPNPWLCAALYAGVACLFVFLGMLLGPKAPPIPAANPA